MFNDEISSAFGGEMDWMEDETGRSQRDADRRAVETEKKLCLKKERANTKRVLARVLNGVSSTLLDESSMAVTSLKDCEQNLCAVFDVFRSESYKNEVRDKDDIYQCVSYLSEAETRFLCIWERVELRLEEVDRIPPDKPSLPDISPEDSISQIASNSTHSFSVSSRSSTISRMKTILRERRLVNATRKASLLAEKSFLLRKQSIAYQELKLNHLKEKLHLQTEITKLDAE